MSTVLDMQNANGMAPSHVNHRRAFGIRGKLIIGFSAVTIIFLLALVITLFAIHNTKNFSQKVIGLELPAYERLADLHGLIYETQLITQNILLSNDAHNKSTFMSLWVSIDKLKINIDEFSRGWNNANLQQWQMFKSSLAELKTAQTKVITLMETDKVQALRLMDSEVTPLLQKVNDQLNSPADSQAPGVMDVQSQQLASDSNEIVNNMSFIQLIVDVLATIGVVAAIVIAIFTSRAIIRQINIFRQLSSKIASGDLTHTATIESFDEIGQLGNDLNTMTHSLAAMTKEMAQACHSMVATLDEVRHAVDAQSSGASEQASSVNEITASLSEIEKSSAQTMEKAKSLGEAAERTREKGQQGLEAVDQSVNGMKEVRDKVQMIAQTILDLSNKTQQVGEITAVVNNLAQQSKMLALNASIEAAKAGEAGKGFAVVAVEVKTLAEQSEEATTQVQKILEDIRHAAEKAVMVTEEGTKGVDHGTTLVEQTGEIIRNLNEVIHETTIATQQIESAIRQEGAGIEQITIGMNEINQVTAAFVESVKQTTEAMANLATISKNLKSYVDAYKI